MWWPAIETQPQTWWRLSMLGTFKATEMKLTLYKMWYLPLVTTLIKEFHACE